MDAGEAGPKGRFGGGGGLVVGPVSILKAARKTEPKHRRRPGNRVWGPGTVGGLWDPPEDFTKTCALH
jgi:hypothetical protein